MTGVPMNGTRRYDLARTFLLALLALAVATATLLGLSPGAARADSAPLTPSDPATPPTVTADGLPTVQQNGVVWAQTTVGNTVYAAGRFTSARPAGAAAGTGETARNNFLAYDITTGNLNTTFVPNLNAQALTVAASPDGTRIYVGGDFTTVNGQSRSRIAAYDTATGALVSTFHPSVGGTVRAIAATNSTVYVGGSFNAVGAVSRTKLAAFSAADGSLLPWAPVPGVGPTDQNGDPSKTPAQNAATDNAVLALVVTGGGSQVVAGGRFYTMNGTLNTGAAALDPVSGANRPFAVNQLITNQGVNSAIYSLSTDGTTVWGSGYDYYGPGNLEGTFQVSANGGQIVAINDCHGDTYSTFATGGALYMASHEHDCGNIGGFPEENPRINKFATAVTTVATGKVGPDTEANGNFIGQPAPSEVPWFPTLSAGSVTGQAQAGWSVTGTSKYVAFGGEFPRVNGVAQQGLVRFAVPSIAPNKIGPAYDATGMTPSVVQLASGVRVAWRSTSDQDNENLTYKVIRSDKPTTPVYQTTAPSQFWQRPALGFIDTTAKAGTTYTYRVYAYDPFNNATNGNATSITVSANGPTQDLYGSTVLADKPGNFWRFDERAGSTTSYDQAGFSDLALGTGVTEGTPGALTGSSDTSAAFNGADSSSLAATGATIPGPQVFSVESWFKTTTTSGGKIVGFGNANTGDSSNYDRHIYMDGSGTVYFGIWLGWSATVQSSQGFNDGAWHHVVATDGPNGLSLFLDGQQVGSRSDATGGQDYSGYWRVGGDSTWAGDNYFDGQIDDVAIYPTVLSADQVSAHHDVGQTGQPFNHPPTAAFSSTTSGLTAQLDGRASSDPDGPIAGYAWDFGDGTTGSGATTSHPYAAAGTYRVKLTVTDSAGKPASVSHLVSVGTAGPLSGAYAQAVQADGAGKYWRLDESSGTAFDAIGADDLNVGSGVSRPTAGALAGDSDTAASFDGSGNGLAAERTAASGPNTFSIEAWFKTTSTSGGKLVGFGNANSGDSSNYDRHIYMDESGTVRFGVWIGSAATVQTPSGQNDGRWHHVVAELSPAGLAMYLDGTAVDRSTAATAGQAYSGYWRIGGDTSWAGDNYFDGQIDDVAIYPAALTDAQVARHHDLGTTTSANTPPTASFTATPNGLGVSVDGTASSDPGGSIASYSWNWGDGTATGSGVTASHTYAAGGTHTITLTVTDNQGATGTTTRDVTLTAANRAPTAAFPAPTPNGLAVSVDGSTSSDPDGTIASYSWNWGDGTAAGSGATASHTYAAGGTRTITLTVTDNQGATGTTSRDVTLTAPNRAPTAAFPAPTPNGLAVSVDGSTSSDPDGTITSYSWNWGDSTAAGSGATASHTYGAGGTYSITLTVTDNGGATSTATRTVTVSPPQAPAIASDTFNRTVSGGLGTADVGGAWTASAGATRQSVTPGVAEMQLTAANQNTGSYLGSVAQTSADIRTSLTATTAPTGSGTYIYVTGRRVNGVGEYRVRVRLLADGRVALALSRLTGTTEAFPSGEIILSGVTYTPGTALNVHVQVFGTGTTTVRASVWTTGSEPTTWQMTRTDTTAGLQANGGVGLAVHRPSDTTANTSVRFSSFAVTAAN